MNVKKLTQILAQKFFENGNYDAIQGGLFKAKGPHLAPLLSMTLSPTLNLKRVSPVYSYNL